MLCMMLREAAVHSETPMAAPEEVSVDAACISNPNQ